MEKVWCDSVDGTALGKTESTFDEVGTVTIKGGQTVKELLGFYILTASTKPTSGENGAPVLQVDSKDLGISQQRFQLANAITDAIDTNDKEAPTFVEFIAFKQEAGKKQIGRAHV